MGSGLHVHLTLEGEALSRLGGAAARLAPLARAMEDGGLAAEPRRLGARLPGTTAAKEDEVILLSFKPSALLLFDGRSGERIVPSESSPDPT